MYVSYQDESNTQPESKFIGYQKSGRSQYEVDIRIKV